TVTSASWVVPRALPTHACCEIFGAPHQRTHRSMPSDLTGSLNANRGFAQRDHSVPGGVERIELRRTLCFREHQRAKRSLCDCGEVEFVVIGVEWVHPHDHACWVEVEVGVRSGSNELLASARLV